MWVTSYALLLIFACAFFLINSQSLLRASNINSRRCSSASFTSNYYLLRLSTAYDASAPAATVWIFLWCYEATAVARGDVVARLSATVSRLPGAASRALLAEPIRSSVRLSPLINDLSV